MAENTSDEPFSGLTSFLTILGGLVAYFYALRGSAYGWEDIRSALLIWLLFILAAILLEFALWLVAIVILVGVIYMEFTDHALLADISQGVAQVGVVSCASALAEWPDSTLVGYFCPQDRLLQQTGLAFQ